jgi:hypothetical protein
VGLPEYLFPVSQRALVRVRPAETANAYNAAVLDYGEAADRETFAGRFEQESTDQPEGNDGRNMFKERWLLLSNYTDIRENDQLEWAENPKGATTYELDGPPEFVNDQDALHHLETYWRKIAG